GVWLHESEQPVYIWVFVVPSAVAVGVLLLYIFLKPLVKGIHDKKRNMVPHITEANIKEFDQPLQYKRIAIAVDFSKADKESIAIALQLGGQAAEFTLIHIVESAGARIYGEDINDYEAESDENF